MSQLPPDKAPVLRIRRAIKAEGRRTIGGPPRWPGDMSPPAPASEVARGSAIKRTRTAVGLPARGPSTARLAAARAARWKGEGLEPTGPTDAGRGFGRERGGME